MPAPKPASLPDWDTTLANLLMPPGGQIASGWANGQVVPSNWLNWWMNLVGQWEDYLNDFEANLHTWIAVQTFSAAPVLSAGFSMTGTETWTPPSAGAAALLASGVNAVVNTRKLLFDLPKAGTYRVRVYFSNTGLQISSNAAWNDATNLWTADNAALPAILCDMGNPQSLIPGLAILRKTSTAAPWNDSSWDLFPVTPIVVSSGGGPGFQNGWVDAFTSPDLARFSRDNFGIVRMSGAVKNPAPGNNVVFTLPAGYRPVAPRLFNCPQQTTPTNFVQVSVDASGNLNVIANALAANEAMWLDGISFETN